MLLPLLIVRVCLDWERVMADAVDLDVALKSLTFIMARAGSFWSSSNMSSRYYVLDSKSLERTFETSPSTF